jgi:hypothetical protein
MYLWALRKPPPRGAPVTSAVPTRMRRSSRRSPPVVASPHPGAKNLIGGHARRHPPDSPSRSKKLLGEASMRSGNRAEASTKRNAACRSPGMMDHTGSRGGEKSRPGWFHRNPSLVVPRPPAVLRPIGKCSRVLILVEHRDVHAAPPAIENDRHRASIQKKGARHHAEPRVLRIAVGGVTAAK